MLSDEALTTIMSLGLMRYWLITTQQVNLLSSKRTKRKFKRDKILQFKRGEVDMWFQKLSYILTFDLFFRCLALYYSRCTINIATIN